LNIIANSSSVLFTPCSIFFQDIIPCAQLTELTQLNLTAACPRHSMSLTLYDVKRIAHLAQLELKDEQAAIALTQLNGIFALAEQMQAVDTDGVEPLSHPLAAYMEAQANPIALRLRADEAAEPNRRDDYLALAPMTQDGLYLVPKVIE
jgi:aspartyl-tRNA(Asn)/glutamyl-tRNA(Gln) amidotransferase subunit C